MKTSLIEQYQSQSAQFNEATRGLTREDFLAFPVAGTWSIQQIVIHLSDSDLIGIDRMKRIIAEENPLLMGYDENAFTKTLSYDDLCVEDALKMFEISRRQFAIVLKNLSVNIWDRTGIHSEIGKVTLGEQLEKYVWHFDHHLGFISKKRKLLGK